jgi:PAS domain S-box-containing protein
MADNAPAMIAMTEEAGIPTYLNRAWRDFRGGIEPLSVAEWSLNVHPDDRSRYVQQIQQALLHQRRLTLEYRLRRSDGQYRWLLDTIVPRYTADERFAGFIGIALDISDRKNAEMALRHSEARLRLITENMADTVGQINAQHHYLYISPSVQRAFGYAISDLLGRSVLEWVHPDDATSLYHQLIMAEELRAPLIRVEYRHRHADGHYLWVESEVHLLYERDDFTGAVFNTRDISSRKQAESEREAVIQELEGKNAELERFTYTVSHDLKSPLITIRGFLGFLERDSETGNRARLKGDLARISDATTRMQRLLDELLELSRIGRVVNQPEEVSFTTIACEAAALVQGRIMAREVTVDITPDMPTVYGDRARLVEVMQNLVDNAVKFMGDQPKPHITIGALRADKMGSPIFFVQDNGIGIDPQYHDRVFGLFNKLDAQTDGTGVGLALVKRIVEVHGGRIWVESELGKGATFYLTLPRPAPTPRKG